MASLGVHPSVLQLAKEQGCSPQLQHCRCTLQHSRCWQCFRVVLAETRQDIHRTGQLRDRPGCTKTRYRSLPFQPQGTGHMCLHQTANRVHDSTLVQPRQQQQPQATAPAEAATHNPSPHKPRNDLLLEPLNSGNTGACLGCTHAKTREKTDNQAMPLPLTSMQAGKHTAEECPSHPCNQHLIQCNPTTGRRDACYYTQTYRPAIETSHSRCDMEWLQLLQL
jgi:hypothetical protein